MLAGRPANINSDEATASIDSGTEQAIQQALAAIRERTTLVVIAHRLSTIVSAAYGLPPRRVERGTHHHCWRRKGATGKTYHYSAVGEELAASVHEESGPTA